MYRRPWMKFLIVLGSVCAAFTLACSVIAFVRIFRVSREVSRSKKTLEARQEEMEAIRKEVKKAARQQEKEAKERKKRGEEIERAFQEEEPPVTVQPSPSPSPTPSLTPGPSPTAVVSANKEGNVSGNLQQAEILSGNRQTENSSAVGVGHAVGIDPGHQGPHVDMSATEPNGPGSGEMKAKATSGTSGAYSGLGEYQLNLDVSLKLQQILEERGYRVIMTRTDNDTAISNAERALLAADEGAEIYVRIHANGSDDHGVQGALSMCPSQENPYVPDLYGESQRLSQLLLDAYCAATGFANRGIQYTDTMTGINWSRVPVSILEMGFMTNEHDDMAMADDGFQQTMAEGIADGIDAYFAEQ